MNVYAIDTNGKIRKCIIDDKYREIIEDKKYKYIKIPVLFKNKTGYYYINDIYTTYEKADIRIQQILITRKIKKNSKWVCHWCGKKIKHKNDCTVDHVYPKSFFKDWKKAWRKENLVISCKRCNKIKGIINPVRNLNIEYRSCLLNKRVNKNKNKILKRVSYKKDNALEIAKRDSRYYNLEAFFTKNSYTLKKKLLKGII